MSVVFGSLFTLNGNGSLTEGDVVAPTQENSQFGVPGTTFLTGPATSRDLSVELWIYNSYATEAALRTAVSSVEAEINKEATLTIEGESYGRCRFDGLSPRRPRPRINSPNLGWLWIGEARFTQLEP